MYACMQVLTMEEKHCKCETVCKPKCSKVCTKWAQRSDTSKRQMYQLLCSKSFPHCALCILVEPVCKATILPIHIMFFSSYLFPCQMVVSNYKTTFYAF